MKRNRIRFGLSCAFNLTSVRETETENILSKFQDVHFIDQFKEYKYCQINENQSIRVSVQGVKSLGGHFASLCRGFEFYEVKLKKNCYYFSKRKWKYFYTFYHFYSEKSSKRAK